MWLSWTISVITGEPMMRQLLLGHSVVSPQHCLARPFKSPVASPLSLNLSLSHSHAILALPSHHLSPSHIPPCRAHHCVASATWQRCFWDDPCCEILKLISVSDRCFLSIAYYNTSASQLEVTWACADVLVTSRPWWNISPAGYFIAHRSVSAQIKPNLYSLSRF